MRELYSGITGLMIFWINIILLFEVVNTEVIIRNIVPIVIAGCYGILSYIAILRVDERVSSLSLCFLLGIGVFLYAFPFKIIIGIYLAVEIIIILWIYINQDIVKINDNYNKDIELKKVREEIKIIKIDKASYVYIIQMKNESEIFIKIGLSDDPNHRLKDIKRAGFEIEIVNILMFKSRKEAEIKERSLHSLYADNKYYPKYVFEGYTECFTIDILDAIILQQDATDLQQSIIKEINEGVPYKEICQRYNVKPYQISRIKTKLNKNGNDKPNKTQS